MITILFFINVFLLILVIKKYTLFSAETMIFFIFFIYGFSFYIDNILFGINALSVHHLGSIEINSDNYLIITLLYTSFLIFYYLGLLTFKKLPNNDVYLKPLVDNKSFQYRLLLILTSLIYVYFIYNLFVLSRSEKILFFSNHKILNTLAAIGLFIFIAVGSKIILTKKRPDFFESFFLVITLLYGLAEGGREIFIYMFLICIPYFKNLKNKLPLFILFPFFVFLITVWKAVSIFIFQLNDIDSFNEWVSVGLKFSFSSLDPIVSLLLLNNYFDGAKIFDNLSLSYVINTFSQFLGSLKIIDYQSIGKQIVEYFDPLAYSKGKGFAFSGILESLLNFWYLGPAIFGLISGTIMSRIRNFNSNILSSTILSAFFVIIMLKLVRTELAVVLKIYVLPMTLAYIMIFKKIRFKY